MRVCPFWLLLPCCLLLTQCAVVRKARNMSRTAGVERPKTMDPQKRGWALMMSDEEFAKIKQDGSATSGSPVEGQPGAAAPGTEGGLFDFSTITQGNTIGGGSRVGWLRSATVAAKQARLTGLPLLIYVTHRSSKPAQDIEGTLMQSQAFITLAQECFVPLLMDFSDPETMRSPLYRELKTRFSIRGYPAILVTLPDSSEIMRLTGYKKDNEKSYLRSIEGAVERADKQRDERRVKLEKSEGYRMWTNKDAKPVFAKLTALDANMGTFTSEWGESFKTFLTRLSAEDQAWIAARRKD